jgi:hypothetical protein
VRRVLATSVLFLTLTGCAGEARKIVGTWHCYGLSMPPNSPYTECKLRLTNAGTYEFAAMPKVIVPNVTRLVQSVGTYKVEAGKLYLQGDYLPPGMNAWKIAGVTDTDLFLETAAGDIAIFDYKRIGP